MLILSKRERNKEREREKRRRERDAFDAFKFYCLQLTSPQDKGLQNTNNLSSRAATCKNHVIPSK